MTFRTAAALAVGLAIVALPAPAQAFAPCSTRTLPSPVSTAVPWQQQLYNPQRIASLADGRGIRVAVVDSGVEAGQPQLEGHVAKGADFLDDSGDGGGQDCNGHGTGVASLIAAQPTAGTPFRGLAPGVTIVPVRVTEKTDTSDGRQADPQSFAAAIDWAWSRSGGNAQVINLSLVLENDRGRVVQTAIERAVANGVVVVAAVGNQGDVDKANPRPLPADFDGVIGVGAIGPDGLRAGYSQHGRYVDVMAAGSQVTVAALQAGHRSDQGTSFAAPFVSATAALILQRFPTLTPAQVSNRILATTDPAPGGRRSDTYGYGLLNPYRALTETLGPQTPAPPAAAALITDDPATVALRERRARTQDVALLVAAAGTGGALLIAVAAAAIRRGRRRHWRPGV